MTHTLNEPVKLSKLDAAIKTLDVRVSWQLLPDLKIPPEGDAFAFLLGKNDTAPLNEDFIFYNQLEGVEGTAALKQDDTQQEGIGGAQSVVLQLNAIRYDITRIIVGFNLYRGNERDQTLRYVESLSVELISNGQIIARTDLDTKTHKDAVAIELLELSREGNDWLLTAQQGHALGLDELARRYGLVVAGGN